MIYFAEHVDTGLIRIGTTNDLDTRMQNHTVNYGEMKVLGLMAGYEDFENELHHKFNHLNDRKTLKGREWFRPEKQLLDYIDKYTSMSIPLPIGNRKRHKSLPQTKKQKMCGIRLSKDTERMVRMLAGEIQYKTGKRCTDDMALQHLLRQAFPEVAAEVFDRDNKS